jgi:3-hydroxybutyryl-CoA dehydrogenase
MKVAVIGAGTMGHGIAQVFAQAGHDVSLVDEVQDALDNALSRITENLDFLTQLGAVDSGESGKILLRIHPSLDLESALINVQFVTEAVSEDLSLKKEIFRRADASTPSDTILASNTSGLSITEIASATTKPARVIGANWWNPPQIIPLVEMAKGDSTSDETVRKTNEILTGVGKKPILVLKPLQGFVGNRLQIALFREALNILEKGVASVEDIDAAVTYGLGFRYAALGPFKVADYGGLDVFYHLSKELYRDLDSSTEPQNVLAKLVREGKLGIKTGTGFYSYDDKKIHEALADRDRKLIRILNAAM